MPDSQPTPTNRLEVETIVRQMIVDTLMLDQLSPDSLEMNEPDFIVRLGANSIDTLELIISVEERFGFEFDDDEIRPDLVQTVGRFVDRICQKCGLPADGPSTGAASESAVSATLHPS